MKYSLILLLAASITLGCTNVTHTKRTRDGNKPAKPPVEEKIADQNNDVSFQSFIGRLRKAVEEKDTAVLASMMTSNFGYRLEPVGEGEGVFKYWDENDVWGELAVVLARNFVPKGSYMVAPPDFAGGEEYLGYRAGMVQIKGSWKFAYFVAG